MNIKEWHKACGEGWAPRKYDNASRELQLSLKYNPDPEATVRHHLRDTEEQRKYNDEHYELWGFEIDEDGNEHFEYGKYIVFVTKEEHLAIHHMCDDTKQKISIANKLAYSDSLLRAECSFRAKNLWATDSYRQMMTAVLKLSHSSQDYKDKMSAVLTSEPTNTKLREAQANRWTPELRKEWSLKFLGENNPMYGKHLSDDTKYQISKNRKGKCIGESHPLYGKHHSEESLEKMSKASKEYWSNEDHCKQQSERCKGRVQSPETVAKRVEKLIGHETSEETRKKISDANSGRVFTDEHREKLCIARRKRVISEDTKSKTSESMKVVMSNEEHRKQISETVKMQKHEKKSLYDKYRSFGGLLMWNDFQSFLKRNFERNYVPTLEELQKALSGSDDEDIDVE